MLSSPLQTTELAIQMILDGALRLSCLGKERDIKEIEAMKTFITKDEFSEMIEHEEGFKCDFFDMDRNIQYFQASAKGCFLMSQRFPNLKFEERKVY